MTDKRKAYEEEFDAQLQEWTTEIALLNVKAYKAEAQAKTEFYEMIETLQGKHDAARTKLHELKTASDDAWDDLKTGAENVWADVKTAFQSVRSRFS